MSDRKPWQWSGCPRVAVSWPQRDPQVSALAMAGKLLVAVAVATFSAFLTYFLKEISGAANLPWKRRRERSERRCTALRRILMSESLEDFLCIVFPLSSPADTCDH